MYIDGVAVQALVDTGAAVSVLSGELCRKLKKITIPLSDVSLRTATAHHIQPSVACTARLVIQNVLYAVEFVVFSPCSHDIILGWDFLSAHHAVVDCARAELELSTMSELPLCQTPIYDGPSDQALSSRVVVAADTHIPPLSSVLVPLSCDDASSVTALFTPSEAFGSRKSFLLPFAVVTIENSCGAIYITNPFSSPATLFRGELIGHLEEIVSVYSSHLPDASTSHHVNSITSDTLTTSSLEAFLPSSDSELPLLSVPNSWRYSIASRRHSTITNVLWAARLPSFTRLTPAPMHLCASVHIESLTLNAGSSTSR